MFRPHGLVTVSGIRDASGKEVSLTDAVRYGWLPNPRGRQPQGWGLDRDELVLGQNIFTDQGRQLLCYCFGFRNPIQNYVCSQFGVGTGVLPAKVTDVALGAPITLNSGNMLGPVDSIDYLSAFVLRVAFTLGLLDANGFLITEMGLFSGNGSMLTRKVRSVGIQKTSDYAPTLLYRVRM